MGKRIMFAIKDKYGNYTHVKPSETESIAAVVFAWGVCSSFKKEEIMKAWEDNAKNQRVSVVKVSIEEIEQEGTVS